MPVTQPVRLRRAKSSTYRPTVAASGGGSAGASASAPAAYRSRAPVAEPVYVSGWPCRKGRVCGRAGAVEGMGCRPGGHCAFFRCEAIRAAAGHCGMIRVLLADDHEILRAGMRRLLKDQSDMAVVAEVSDAYALLESIQSANADVAVIDISMAGPPIEETIARARQVSTRTRILVLSAHPPEQYAARVLRAGAAGFLTKHQPWSEVLTAIRKAAAGGRYVTPAVAESLAESIAHPTTSDLALSTREQQVLEMMARGKTPKEIAQHLNVSPKTVHSYRARLLVKLQLRTNADLIRYALEHHFAP